MSAVKQHTRVVGGKRILVKRHDRAGGEHSHLLDRIKNRDVADEVGKKYKDFPNTLSLMLDTKWGDVEVTKYRTENGERIPYKATKRLPMLTGKQWRGLVDENMRAVNSLINRFFNYDSDIKDDLRAEGRRAIVEAASAYEKKYNPQDPSDWYRHLYSYARGFMQAELNKQVSGTIAMPSHKARLFGQFKSLWVKHQGDHKKIAADMDLKKKDLYPNLKGDEGNEPLPMEGYVTVAKQEKGTIAKKMQAHERRVNDIQEAYMRGVSALDDRRAFDNPNAQKEFDTYLLDYDKQIEVQRVKLNDVDGDAKLSVEAKIKDLEQSKDLYAKSFKPITSEAEYEAEKKVLQTVMQSELRDAKSKMESDIDRTTVTGVNDLFKEFEAMMDMTEVNVSGNLVGSDGGSRSMEEIVSGDDITESDRISIKEDYKQYVEKFLSDINKLDERTATVLKMSLGLHEKNELYSHGIWGVPMTPKEIAENLPKGTYPIRGSMSEESRLRSWEGSKPERTVKVKLSKEEFSKQESDYARRKKDTEDKIKKIIPSLKEKYGPNDRKKIIEKIRDNAKVGHHGETDYRPKKFVQKELSDSEYKDALSKWEASKPKSGGRQRTLEDRIKRDIELGTIALRRISDKKNVSNMMSAVRTMRHYGIDRPKLKEGLQKAMIFEQTIMGVDPERENKADSEVDIVDKVKGAAARFLAKIDAMFSFMK